MIPSVDNVSLLTPEQVAERVQLPRAEVQAWVESGALAHLRFGKKVRIPPAALDVFIEQRKIRSAPDFAKGTP